MSMEAIERALRNLARALDEEGHFADNVTVQYTMQIRPNGQLNISFQRDTEGIFLSRRFDANRNKPVAE